MVARKKKKNMKGRKRGGASVPCPECDSNSRVTLTRREGLKVIRHRLCSRHDHSFSTVEKIA